MLTLPDFEEKQILIIQAEHDTENKIKFWNDNIRFIKNDEIVNQASCYKIFAVFIIGDISITNVLISKCKTYGISMYLLDRKLRYQAEILSQTEGNYLLRQKQYNFKDELDFSKNIIKNKIANQYFLLKESGKNYKISLSKINSQINEAKTQKELLGVEGSTSKEFFKLYFDKIGWKKRLPRTKIDISNFLLDIGYYYLFNFVDSLLRLFGFDTFKGIYHKLFFQRRSLACDIMEPFRCLIDREILKSFNLKKISTKDFRFRNGRYEIDYIKSGKYSEIFLELLIDYNGEIYNYVKNFYYCLMNDSNDYPKFLLGVKTK